VVALHGVGELGPGMMRRTGMSDKADAEGFAIVYPNARMAALSGVAEWNVFFSASFGANPPDDTGFLRELIRVLQAELKPDPARVYVTGLSNGALMTHRLGVELGDVVAAIGVVSGTIATAGASLVPTAKSPVSVLIIHGDADEYVPCCPLKSPATQDESFNYWAGPKANACATVTPSGRICAGTETPGTLADKRATACAGGAEVHYYQLTGGTHQWYTIPMNMAGAAPYNPLLNVTTGVTTNDLLWNFFKSHPKGSVATGAAALR